MIKEIHPLGQVVGACTQPGDTPADRRKPSHVNGIQVSRDRWLLVMATRGFRGGDDDCSIVFQLRRDTPDGPLIREGTLARQVEWQPFEGVERLLAENSVCVKEHGHPVAFGVPRGALVNGRRVPHENVFVVKWRSVGRMLKKSNNHCLGHDEIRARTQDVEWVQVRLNDAGDDLEVLSAARPLRQVGFPEDNRTVCEVPGMGPAWNMNQTFTQAVPYNDDRSEWADYNYFFWWDKTKRPVAVAPLRYRFNPRLGFYEWVETGRMLPDLDGGEPSLLRTGSDWAVSTRASSANRAGGFGAPEWFRINDLFAETATKVSPRSPVLSSAPRLAFMCPDGQIRLIGNARDYAPHAAMRDPLFIWDIDADTLEATAERQLFNSRRFGLEMVIPMNDFGSLLPHAGGRIQYALHRTWVMACDYPRTTAGQFALFLPQIKNVEFEACGVYGEKIVYDDEYPATWCWDSARASC